MLDEARENNKDTDAKNMRRSCEFRPDLSVRRRKTRIVPWQNLDSARRHCARATHRGVSSIEKENLRRDPYHTRSETLGLN